MSLSPRSSSKSARILNPDPPTPFPLLLRQSQIEQRLAAGGLGLIDEHGPAQKVVELRIVKVARVGGNSVHIRFVVAINIDKPLGPGISRGRGKHQRDVVAVR